MNTLAMRFTYAGVGLLVTSFWINCRARNGPTLGCMKILLSASARSSLIGRFAGELAALSNVFAVNA